MGILELAGMHIIQSFAHQVSVADPSAPPDIPQPKWQQQQSEKKQVYRVRFQENLESETASETMRGNLGGVTTNGMIAQSGNKTHGANLTRNSNSFLFLQRSATKRESTIERREL